jgi:speckle-type POZ protein
MTGSILQDPNARNCHGYRKFVRRSTLENPANGYLLNDTIVIRYTIELVVSSGGALTRAGQPVPRAPSVQVPLTDLCGCNSSRLSSCTHDK